jgi:signal transduction histidine kinase
MVGGIFFLLKRDSLSSLLFLMGSIALSFVVSTPRLPNHKRIIQDLLAWFIFLCTAAILYLFGFRLVQNLLPALVARSPLLTGLLLTLLLLGISQPLFRISREIISVLVRRRAVDQKQLIWEYSQSISDIVELDQLARIGIDLIKESIEVKSGMFFTVDSEYDEVGELRYRVKEIPLKMERSPLVALIPLKSPIAVKLGKQKQHLLQSEVDVLPAFRFLSQAEKGWVNSSKMDIFIPIHFRNEWVGMFGFGPKGSGDIFYDQDIEVMMTLANQTAVALQNARLVNSLVRINKEFRRANSVMQEANIKLTKIDSTKSDFISIASNELRTPLTVLSGYSQILLEDPELMGNDYYQKIASGIYDGTTRLHEIVDSMLDVAEIDAQGLELKSELVDIYELLKDLLNEYSCDFQVRDLHFNLHQELESLPAIQADSLALRKVFYHLIINAVKYTPDGGEIAITGKNVPEGDTRMPVGGVEIIVSDTGIGIDPRYQDLIFSKFYQTGEIEFHSTGKTKFKGGGPGLGLTIVRGIIHAHGGRVWVESPGYDEDKTPGSHFHVLLPLFFEPVILSTGELDV